jgi:hypothetical protein
MISLGKDLKWESSEAAARTYKLRVQKERIETQRKNAILRNFRVPFQATQNILLVGEANCSFARALVRYFRKRIGLLPVPEKLAAERLAQRQAEAAAAGEDMVDEDVDEDGFEGDFEGDDEGDDADEEDAELMDEDEDEGELDEDEDEGEDEEEEEEEREEEVATESAAEVKPPKMAHDVTAANCGTRLLVTCYDSLEDSLRKYPDLPDILAELHAAGARVVFEVDAATLHSALAGADLIPAERFDRIVFNFPHVGSGEQDKEKAVAENQALLIQFLSQTLPLLRKPAPRQEGNEAIAEEAAAAARASLAGVGSGARAGSAGAAAGTFDARDPAVVARVMARVARDQSVDLREATLRQNIEALLRERAERIDRGGEIHLTLKTGHPYDRWRPTLLAKTLNDMQAQAQATKEAATGAQEGKLWGRFPRLALLRCVPFLPQVYNGYAHRRTLGFKAGVEDNEDIVKHDGARTYVFTRAPAGHSDPALGLDGEGIDEEGKKVKHKQPKKASRKNKQFKRRGKNKPSLRGWL